MGWHQKEIATALAELGTVAAHGLPQATMVLILMAAAVISVLLGKWQEAVAIPAIVILFVLLGFVQEYRAERAMAALKAADIGVAMGITGAA